MNLFFCDFFGDVTLRVSYMRTWYSDCMRDDDNLFCIGCGDDGRFTTFLFEKVKIKKQVKY